MDLERSRQSWGGSGAQRGGGVQQECQKKTVLLAACEAGTVQGRGDAVGVGGKAEGQGWWVEMQGWRGIEEMTFTRL